MQSGTSTMKKKRRKYHKNLTCSLDLSRDDKDILDYFPSGWPTRAVPSSRVVDADDVAAQPSINLNHYTSIGDLWLILL